VTENIDYSRYVWPMRYRLTRGPYIAFVYFVLFPVVVIWEWFLQRRGSMLFALVTFALGYWLGRR